MSNNPIKELMRFQLDRGLDQHEYQPINEHTNIIEELLESVGLDIPKENRKMLQMAWMKFVSDIESENIGKRVILGTEAPDIDKVDAYADVIVFAVGTIMKLGFNPLYVLEEVGFEINSRVGTMVDGKFEKDLSPEAKANWYKADYSKCKAYVDHSENDSIDLDKEI